MGYNDLFSLDSLSFSLWDEEEGKVFFSSSSFWVVPARSSSLISSFRASSLKPTLPRLLLRSSSACFV